MNDQELLKWARRCVDPEGICRDCPFDRPSILSGFCAANMIRALTDRVETLADRCARYAEEIAVQQERERWISVEERLPEDCADVLTLVSGVYGKSTAELARFDKHGRMIDEVPGDQAPQREDV